MDQSVLMKVKETVENMICGECKVLSISLTGAWGFGWGFGNLDHDLAVLYHCKVKHPSYMYFDLNVDNYALDINVRSVKNLLYSGFAHPSFESIVQYADAEYIDPEFKPKWDIIESHVNELFVWKGYIEEEIERFERYPHPRSALHAYRVILQPIYTITKKKLKKNIFEIIDELGLSIEGPHAAKEAYKEGKKLSDSQTAAVTRELYNLKDMLYKLLERSGIYPSTNWDNSVYRDWFSRAENIIFEYFKEYI